MSGNSATWRSERRGLFVALYFIALVFVAIPPDGRDADRPHGGKSVSQMNVLVAATGFTLLENLGSCHSRRIPDLELYCVICVDAILLVFGCARLPRHGWRSHRATHRMLASPGSMMLYSGYTCHHAASSPERQQGHEGSRAS